MKSKTLLLLVLLAVVAAGAFYALTRPQETPAPVAEAEKPAAEASQTAPAASDSMAGMGGNAPAAKPAGTDCTQYTWDGVQWTCTSAAAGN